MCDDVVLLDVLLDDVSFDDVPVELLFDADEFSLSLSTVNSSRESRSSSILLPVENCATAPTE